MRGRTSTSALLYYHAARLDSRYVRAGVSHARYDSRMIQFLAHVPMMGVLVRAPSDPIRGKGPSAAINQIGPSLRVHVCLLSRKGLRRGRYIG